MKLPPIFVFHLVTNPISNLQSPTLENTTAIPLLAVATTTALWLYYVQLRRLLVKDVDVNEPLGFDQAARYQIKVQGRLDEKWSDWFGGMTVMVQSESNDAPITTLTGAVADQSALRGILDKIWDLNLTLISVTRTMRRVEMDSKDES